MNNLKSGIGVIAVFAIACLGGVAANAELKLITPEYDFGIIREADGTKMGSAALVNIGDSATFIRDVRPSCGCTGAYYYEGEIAPGDTTYVTFEYNPAGRPGNFNKTVKVYEGGSGERHIIKLTGRVVGTPQTLSRNYPIECGKLRLSERIVNLAKVNEGAGRHVFIRLVNQSMDSVVPVWTNHDKALSIDITPKTLAPGEIASLGIYFNSRFEERTGEVEYTIPIRAEGDSTSVDIIVKSDIVTLPKRDKGDNSASSENSK